MIVYQQKKYSYKGAPTPPIHIIKRQYDGPLQPKDLVSRYCETVCGDNYYLGVTSGSVETYSKVKHFNNICSRCKREIIIAKRKKNDEIAKQKRDELQSRVLGPQ